MPSEKDRLGQVINILRNDTPVDIGLTGRRLRLVQMYERNEKGDVGDVIAADKHSAALALALNGYLDLHKDRSLLTSEDQLAKLVFRHKARQDEDLASEGDQFSVAMNHTPRGGRAVYNAIFDIYKDIYPELYVKACSCAQREASSREAVAAEGWWELGDPKEPVRRVEVGRRTTGGGFVETTSLAERLAPPKVKQGALPQMRERGQGGSSIEGKEKISGGGGTLKTSLAALVSPRSPVREDSPVTRRRHRPKSASDTPSDNVGDERVTPVHSDDSLRVKHKRRPAVRRIDSIEGRVLQVEGEGDDNPALNEFQRPAGGGLASLGLPSVTPSSRLPRRQFPAGSSVSGLGREEELYKAFPRSGDKNLALRQALCHLMFDSDASKLDGIVIGNSGSATIKYVTIDIPGDDGSLAAKLTDSSKLTINHEAPRYTIMAVEGFLESQISECLSVATAAYLARQEAIEEAASKEFGEAEEVRTVAERRKGRAKPTDGLPADIVIPDGLFKYPRSSGLRLYQERGGTIRAKGVHVNSAIQSAIRSYEENTEVHSSIKLLRAYVGEANAYKEIAEELEAELRDATRSSARVSELEAQLDEARSRAEESLKQAEELAQSRERVLELELAAEQRGELDAEARAAISEAGKLNLEVATLRERLEGLVDVEGGLQKALDEKHEQEEKLKELAESLAESERARNKAVQKAGKLEEQLSKAEEDLDLANISAGQKQGEVDKLQATVAELRAEVERNAKTIKTERDNTSLAYTTASQTEANLRSAKEALREARKQKSAAEKAKEVAEKAREEVSRDLRLERVETERLQQEVARLNDNLDKASTEKRAVLQQVKEWKRKYNAEKDRADRSEGRVADISKELAETRNELASALQREENASGLRSSAEAARMKHKSDLDKVRQERDGLRKLLGDTFGVSVSGDIALVQAIKERQEAALRESTQPLTRKNRELAGELIKLRAQLTQEEADKRNAVKERDKATSALDVLSKNHEEQLQVLAQKYDEAEKRKHTEYVRAVEKAQEERAAGIRKANQEKDSAVSEANRLRALFEEDLAELQGAKEALEEVSAENLEALRTAVTHAGADEAEVAGMGVKDLQELHAQKLGELNDKIQAGEEKIARKSAELQEFEKKYQARLRKLVEEHQQALTKVQDGSSSAVEEASAAAKRKAVEAESRHQDEMQALREEYEEKLRIEEERADKAAQDAALELKRHEEELRDLKEVHASAMSELAAVRDGNIEALREVIKRLGYKDSHIEGQDLEALKMLHEAGLKKLEDAVERAEAVVNEKAAAFEKVAGEHSRILAEQEQAHLEVLAEKEAKIVTLSSSLAAMEVEAQRNKVILGDLQRQLAKLEISFELPKNGDLKAHLGRKLANVIAGSDLRGKNTAYLNLEAGYRALAGIVEISDDEVAGNIGSLPEDIDDKIDKMQLLFNAALERVEAHIIDKQAEIRQIEEFSEELGEELDEAVTVATKNSKLLAAQQALAEKEGLLSDVVEGLGGDIFKDAIEHKTIEEYRAACKRIYPADQHGKIDAFKTLSALKSHFQERFAELEIQRSELDGKVFRLRGVADERDALQEELNKVRLDLTKATEEVNRLNESIRESLPDGVELSGLQDHIKAMAKVATTSTLSALEEKKKMATMLREACISLGIAEGDLFADKVVVEDTDIEELNQLLSSRILELQTEKVAAEEAKREALGRATMISSELEQRNAELGAVKQERDVLKLDVAKLASQRDAIESKLKSANEALSLGEGDDALAKLEEIKKVASQDAVLKALVDACGSLYDEEDPADITEIITPEEGEGLDVDAAIASLEFLFIAKKQELDEERQKAEDAIKQLAKESEEWEKEKGLLKAALKQVEEEVAELQGQLRDKDSKIVELKDNWRALCEAISGAPLASGEDAPTLISIKDVLAAKPAGEISLSADLMGEDKASFTIEDLHARLLVLDRSLKEEQAQQVILREALVQSNLEKSQIENQATLDTKAKDDALARVRELEALFVQKEEQMVKIELEKQEALDELARVQEESIRLSDELGKERAKYQIVEESLAALGAADSSIGFRDRLEAVISAKSGTAQKEILLKFCADAEIDIGRDKSLAVDGLLPVIVGKVRELSSEVEALEARAGSLGGRLDIAEKAAQEAKRNEAIGARDLKRVQLELDEKGASLAERETIVERLAKERDALREEQAREKERQDKARAEEHERAKAIAGRTDLDADHARRTAERLAESAKRARAAAAAQQRKKDARLLRGRETPDPFTTKERVRANEGRTRFESRGPETDDEELDMPQSIGDKMEHRKPPRVQNVEGFSSPYDMASAAAMKTSEKGDKLRSEAREAKSDAVKLATVGTAVTVCSAGLASVISFYVAAIPAVMALVFLGAGALTGRKSNKLFAEASSVDKAVEHSKAAVLESSPEEVEEAALETKKLSAVERYAPEGKASSHREGAERSVVMDASPTVN